ncbi:PDDEXK nuclease domain-containing protein [Zhenpiania hominis]|uniref:PDDEXK nuclease domain-containing protein n=1 Tax=Zhenpiania hominis TaxID=2763644 RepID=UPI001FADB040|nr:PDDEXK nuclease domain-containing protein [Zhenpiania hominis]
MENQLLEEQGGNEKAEYGTGLLKELSKQMTQDFGKGFTVANLKNMRQFYLTFPNGYALRSELSWTHYRLLMRVENENAREFYMQEAVKSQWSTRQLERQINSFFYERLLSSKNKEQVAEEIQTLEPAKKPEDVIRDPYVLEFLGLTPNDDFYESDLEQALITHLQKFLLELGRGFSFVARQKRITFDASGSFLFAINIDLLGEKMASPPIIFGHEKGCICSFRELLRNTHFSFIVQGIF